MGAHCFAFALCVSLSFNNLTTGLERDSFAGWWSIGLSNCNLRSSSLPPGVFDFTGITFQSSLFLNNLEPTSIDALGTEYYGRWIHLPLAPRFDLDPLQRLIKGTRLNPPNEQWAFRPPTPALLAASWANVFDPFPAGVLYQLGTGSTVMRRQYEWNQVMIGSVVSFAPAFLGNLTGFIPSFNPALRLSVFLAPQTALASVAYCPVHSLLTAVARAATVGQLMILPTFAIRAYDLPSPAQQAATCGPLPQCVGCRQILTAASEVLTVVSIEPALMQRDLVRFLAQAGVSSLTFAPPPMQLWNAALNQSNWVDPQLFCDTGFNAPFLAMPALPFNATSAPSVPRFPFPPPSGMLSCLRNMTQLTTLDWSSLTLFPSDLLRGMNTPLGPSVSLLLNIDLLVGTDAPVPPGFFDDRPLSWSVPIGCDENWLPSTCARVASSSACPYIVSGVCQPCPPGYSRQALGTTNNYIGFCASCPRGYYCNATAAADPQTAIAQQWSRQERKQHTQSEAVEQVDGSQWLGDAVCACRFLSVLQSSQ